MCTFCPETKERKAFDYADKDYISKLTEYLQSEDWTYVMHNGIEYDRYVLSHFTGLPLIPHTKIIDTLILSRLYNSGREGGHSLERWGKYLHINKVGQDQWEVYDPNMVKRCTVDVAITYKLWKHLQKEGKNVSQFAVKLEHEFVDLLCEMRATGFPVDCEAIQESLALNVGRKKDIEGQVQKAFPPRAKRIAEINPKRTKSGAFARNTKGFKQVTASLVWGPFTLIEWEEFNLGSSKQVVERMNEAGWEPVEFTKGGADGKNKQPKVSPANLDTLPDTAPESAKLISEYLKLETRIGLMENWLANYNPNTGRIHGNVIHIGTITHRCSHNNPNTGNIPNTHGGEIREHWGYKHGDRRLVGVDAKGIQLRILAHLTAGYTDDTSFMEAVLHGDPHTDFTLPRVAAIHPECVAYNTPEELHHVKQAKTKRFIYAYLLGAGDLKTGVIFGVSAKEGKAIRNGFTEAFPGLNGLREYLAECAHKGWYPLPTGCYAPVKSEHYALSVALQGIEACVMKLAGILWRRERDKLGLDAALVGFVHDEFVIDSHKDCAVIAGDLMVSCIIKAGEILRLRCPMDGSRDIGMNWREVH